MAIDNKNKKQFAAEYFNKLAQLKDRLNLDEIEKVMDILEDARKNNKYIFVAGNGGSAATASHMVCDLEKTVLGKDLNTKRKRFRLISLSDNVPMLTAIGNDCSYDQSFSEQLKTLGNSGDVLLVISGSGNSKNIIEAIKEAKKLKMEAVGFLGFDGGLCRKMLAASILIPSNEYGPIEDYHMILDHMMTAYFKNT